MTNKKLIQVTQEDILHPQQCPVNTAMCRAFGVEIRPDGFTGYTVFDLRGKRILLPHIAQDFIYRWDRQLEVEPIEFEVSYYD
jgi:hypothetical protein